ncbi:MAG: diheme cytochrome c precursor [Pirellulales bacterium]|nr:diheme cytochrome c precursor [Pirellulales bacterium]
MTKPADQSAKRWDRLGHMALAVTIGVSVAGFLVGVRDRSEPALPSLSQASEIPPDVDHAAVVVEYARMAAVRRGPNAEWSQSQSLPTLRDDPVEAFGSASPSADQRRATVAARTLLRAFSGAPPVVPHAVDERNPQACLACHGTGLKVGEVVAPRMSHQMLPNCTQCHVEARQDAPWATASQLRVESNFAGLVEPGSGDRIGPGAPPTIPHRLWMRSDCTACHGALAGDGLRTSHPWRTNCTQCHVPAHGFEWAGTEDAPPGAAASATDDETISRWITQP